MHKSYRSLWNAALSSWVAAPETARTHSSGTSRVRGMLSALRLTTLVVALATAWATLAAAATLYWDINGVTPGLGGAGIWNTANNFWNTSSTGTGGTPSIWNNGALDDAVFDGPGGAMAVTLGTPITVHNLTFGALPSYTLSGSTLTLAGTTPTINTLQQPRYQLDPGRN
jgi:fibronectin-binding autotransporter adhesin